MLRPRRAATTASQVTITEARVGREIAMADKG
jgi:hypothetical protein